MKNNPMFSWNVVMGLSMAVMAAALVYEKVVPYPKFELSGKAKADQIGRAREQSYAASEQTSVVKEIIAGRIWSEEAEAVGPKAMATATDLAKRFNLKLSSFRPQKIVLEGELERIPYVVALEGEYRDVVLFLNELEMPATKLVLNSAQISSADGATSNVRASVGIWALRWTRAPKDLWPTPSIRTEPESNVEPIKQAAEQKGGPVGNAS